MSQDERITIEVDDRPVSGYLGQPLIEVLSASGIEVPTLCHHPSLSALGACRVCLVEIAVADKPPRLSTACNHPLLPELVVRTDSPWVRRSRQVVFELLLALAPGSPELVALAAKHGATPDSGVERDAERCVRCGLCVRVCTEVVGARALGWQGRGHRRRVATAFDDWPHECVGCGACAAVCPTAAIHMEAGAVRRFLDRPGAERDCRYSLLGLHPGAICPNSYQCWRCAVEQRLSESMTAHPAFLQSGALLPALETWLRDRERMRQP